MEGKLEHIVPRIMFDTNTYRNIIDGTADNNNSSEVYTRINALIKEGKIEAFLSETLFTIEAIIKKERLSFMSQYNPQVNTRTTVRGNMVAINATLGPDMNHMVSFEGSEPLGDYFRKALEIGFKIIRLPRICGIQNAEIDDSMQYIFSLSSDFDSYYTKACEVGEKIEEKGAGMSHVDRLLSQYDTRTNDLFCKFDYLMHDVNELPHEQRKAVIKKVAKAIAEVSDGDSVASSIGLRCDAFCTNDRAVNAGEGSVFSAENVNWLKEQYGFNKLTPTELIDFLQPLGVATKLEH